MADMPDTPQVIKSRPIFPMMELPPELRLKIYAHLLISVDDIAITTTARESLDSLTSSASPRPLSVAILQTCKLINEEGTPILYADNTFTIWLSMDESPSFFESCSFLLSNLRWGTLSLLSKVSFMNNPNSLPDITPRPSFTCSGKDIISRYPSDPLEYYPDRLGEYMALSVSNWVSLLIMRATLVAFQMELDMIMRPSEALAAALTDDPAT